MVNVALPARVRLLTMITWEEKESVPAETCVNPAALPVDDGALQLAAR